MVPYLHTFHDRRVDDTRRIELSVRRPWPGPFELGIKLGVFFLFLSLLPPSELLGATRTWTGNAGSAWSNPANWDAAGLAAGDDIVFPLNALTKNSLNDLPAGTAVNSITISGSDYVLAGNAVRISAGGIVSSGSANIGFPIELAADQRWTADATLTIAGNVVLAGSTLTLEAGSAGAGLVTGVISGAGAIVKRGIGSFDFAGANTFAGLVAVEGGVLIASNRLALGIGDDSEPNGTLIRGSLGPPYQSGALRLNNVAVSSERVTLAPHPSAGWGLFPSLRGSGASSHSGTIVLLSSRVAIGSETNGSLTLNGRLRGPGGFSQFGDVTLRGVGSDFASDVNRDAPCDIAFYACSERAGRLTLDVNEALPSTAALNVAYFWSSVVDLRASSQTLRSVSTSPTGTLILGGNLTVTDRATIRGPLTGTGDILFHGRTFDLMSSSNWRGTIRNREGGVYVRQYSLPEGQVVWSTTSAGYEQVGGLLDIAGGGTLTGPVTIHGGAISVHLGPARFTFPTAYGDTPYSAQTGPLTLTSSATFATTIWAPEPIVGWPPVEWRIGHVYVFGNVRLGDAKLTITSDPPLTRRLPPGTILPIIINRGSAPIEGTFEGLPEGAIVSGPGGPYRITYVSGGKDVALTVLAETAITLNAVPTVVSRGTSAQLTATVTSDGVPATGTVSFFDGNMLLGTAALEGGKAVFTLEAPGIGTHFLSASYSGADVVAPSTSTVLSLVVLDSVPMLDFHILILLGAVLATIAGFVLRPRGL